MFTAMSNGIEEDEDILLLEGDGQPSTTLINIMMNKEIGGVFFMLTM